MDILGASMSTAVTAFDRYAEALIGIITDELIRISNMKPQTKKEEENKMSSLTVPSNLSSPRQDAIDLYKAFKGFGCDSSAVVKILAHRDVAQRSLIDQEYKTMYHEDLTTRLSKELSGNLKRAMLLWILNPAARDATILWEALTGDIIALDAATEVLCSRTPSQIQIIKQTYLKMFESYIEHDLETQAAGDHLKLLLSYISTIRYEGFEVDHSMALKDAKDLFKAGEKKLGTDEKVFVCIFSERSRAHLAAVASAYHDAYGSLAKAIKGETSGQFQFALLTILRCAQNPAKYFAKSLRYSMKGLGTSDTMLIRIVVSRTEIDMQHIKAEYHKKNKKTLSEAIHSETSGNYRTFLLGLVGPGP